MYPVTIFLQSQLSLTLLPPSSTYTDSCDFTGPTMKIQDNLLISRYLNLITLTKSLLLKEQHIHRSKGLEYKHLWDHDSACHSQLLNTWHASGILIEVCFKTEKQYSLRSQALSVLSHWDFYHGSFLSSQLFPQRVQCGCCYSRYFIPYQRLKVGSKSFCISSLCLIWEKKSFLKSPSQNSFIS